MKIDNCDNAIPLAETRWYAVNERTGDILLYGNPNEGLEYGCGGWNAILYGKVPVQCNIKYFVEKELVKARKNWRDYHRKGGGHYNRHALTHNPYKEFKAVRCNMFLLPLPARQKRTIKKPSRDRMTDMNEIKLED